jgi:hypothetical protein
MPMASYSIASKSISLGVIKHSCWLLLSRDDESNIKKYFKGSEINGICGFEKKPCLATRSIVLLGTLDERRVMAWMNEVRSSVSRSGFGILFQQYLRSSSTEPI